MRSVIARRFDHTRQQSAFRQCQFLRALLKIGVGGGFNAVGPAAKINHVEVALEDVVLLHAPLELQGQYRFLRFAGERFFAAQVREFDQLLRDG